MEEIGSGIQQRLVNFKLQYYATQMIGAVLIILVISWIGIHMGGFGWSSNPALQFNWHPVLMVIAMIFLYGNSILVYRGFRHVRKKNLKLSHAAIHGTILLLVIIGLAAAFGSHNNAIPPIPNLYSLHSWIGLLAVIMFASQWLIGFMVYLYPGFTENVREAMMPVHVLFGLIIFVLACATSLLGLSEKAFFRMKNIAELPNEALLVNMIGFVIVLFGGMVCYLVTERSYIRQPLPEDAMLLRNVDD